MLGDSEEIIKQDIKKIQVSELCMVAHFFNPSAEAVEAESGEVQTILGYTDLVSKISPSFHP